MRRLPAEFRESLRMALSALASHKLRSSLTLLGVMVGVFSIILVMTAVRAMKNNIEKEMGALGSRTFAITRFPAVNFGGPHGFMKFLRRKEITLQQAMRFKKAAEFAPFVGLHAGFGSFPLTSRFAETPPNVPVEGATPGVFQTNNWTMVEGRPLLDSDVDSARDVCVLSVELARTLFPLGSPLGQRVKIEAINYTVTGVLERVGSSEAKALAVIPVTTGLNRFGRRRDVSILVQAADVATLGDSMEQARGVLRAIRKVAPGQEDDFEMLTSDSLIKQFNDVTFAVRIGLALISSIALLAAGVGIMNIMLVSVTERTREIGVRRAIGAKKRSIMSQFIIEAVVLCEIGGLLGVVLGLAGANAVAVYLLKVPPAFPLDWALIGVGICSLVGIVFGSYPAYKAANLDPIESLRYE
jgi:putative ABC transport system permease protein